MSRTLGGGTTCQRRHSKSEMPPAIGKITGDPDFLNLRLAVEEHLASETAGGGCECGSTAHRGAARNEKNDVFGHEAEESLGVAICGGSHPSRNNLTNLLFIIFVVHKV